MMMTTDEIMRRCSAMAEENGEERAAECQPVLSNVAVVREDDDDDEADALDSGDENSALYEHFRVVADRGQQLLRVDKFLVDHLPDTSRHRIQQAARAGFIHVNGKPVKSNYRVKPRDIVTLLLDRPRYDTTIEPEDIPLDVVYEDDALMVINKPAGMVVHPGCGNYSGTLVNAIAWHLRHCPGYDPNDPAVGLVHRIDKDTSGLLVVAKTPVAKTSLGVQFFHKTTRRQYLALVWGNPQGEGGGIGSIGRRQTVLLLVVEGDEVAQAVGFHLIVVDDVDTEVEQVLAVFAAVGDEGADGHLEFVEHGFVHDARRTDEAVKQTVFLYRAEVLGGNLQVSRAALVELDVEHGNRGEVKGLCLCKTF